MSELEEAGFVQRFEFTLELAWKTLRDYLIEEGFSPASPKETIRQAYEAGYIEDVQIWMDMIDLRNTFFHDYDGKLSHEQEYFLREDAFQALSRVAEFFRKKYD
jgi:nucleotidyltransferase substrate binding protein (TIGR01987 family)